MFGLFGALDKVLGAGGGIQVKEADLQRLGQAVANAVSQGKKETAWLSPCLQHEKLIDLWKSEHPELFFLYEFRILKESTGRWKLQFRYAFTGKQLAEVRLQLEMAVQTAVGEIKDSFPASEYEGLLRIYEYLQDHVVYDMAAANAFFKGKGHGIEHSAYGALVRGKAVCDGIASGFLLIARALGYESIMVIGTGNKAAHAWNMVKISGQWYHLDCTWDINQHMESGEYSYHSLLLSDTLIATDHQWQRKQYPACTTEGKSHHHRVGSYLKSQEELRKFLHGGLAKKRKKFSFRLAPNVKITDQPLEFCMKCLREKQYIGSARLLQSESANCFFLRLDYS